MKNKKVYVILIVLILIGSIFLTYNIYQNKNKIIKTKKRKQNNLAIMIKEDGATDYIKSNSKDIPKGDYVLNRDKSYCKNNGKIGDYDSVLGKVSFSFIGTDSCFLYFDYDSEPKGYEKILLDNGNGATTVDEAKVYIEGKGIPDFSATATTNEGMYAKEDDYTATTGMKSYYFRGAVNNNWVKFGKENGKDIYWRIIRINGDGSIRMIYSGTTAPIESTKVVMTGTGTQITVDSTNTFKFNSRVNKAEYVGYQYIEEQQHGYGECNGTSASCTVNENTVYNSTIKQVIDKWYAGTTLEKDAATKELVSQDQIFCNDRSASTSAVVYSSTNYTTLTSWNSVGTTYYYGAYGRLDKSKSPILTCPTANDKFTSKKSSIGNKALTYPVGLITADEVAMAGGVKGTSNNSYYLYTNQNYWSGSPSGSNGRLSAIASGFDVDSSGYVSSARVDNTYGPRPVVSLSSKAKLLGNGTWNNVYRVTTDDSTEDTSSGKSFDTVFAANNTDIFNENGIRYEGADPNNYICLDNKTEGTCSDSSLLFRIIGLFDEDTSSDGTTSSGTKKLLKVIDTNNYGGTEGTAWSQTQADFKAYNDWSEATLKTELNGTYLTTLLGTSNVNNKLSSGIANAKWHLGGASSSNVTTLTADGIYAEERNPNAIYIDENYIINPSSIYAKVGLMYPSDYGYATVGGSTINRTGCRAKALHDYDTADCYNNDWIFKSQSSFVDDGDVDDGEWLISPATNGTGVAVLDSTGLVFLRGGSQTPVFSKLAVRPTFYLDSSVLKIVGTGDGTKDNAYRVG